MSAPTRAQLHETAHAVIASYKAWTADAILAVRSSDCTQQILPLSLGRAPMSNEQYMAWWRTITDIYKDFTPEVINDEEETIVDIEQRKVCMHVRSTGTTPWGVYKNEYCMRIWMTEDGKLSRRIDEFVDSATSIYNAGKLKEYREQNEA